MANKFCLYPWIHSHVLPNGDVTTCCAAPIHSVVLGNVHERPLEQIWNDEPYKKVRRDMLAGKEIDFCKGCYTAEDTGGTSQRLKAERDYAHLTSLVQKTSADGSLPDFRMYYYDVRFSNLCNLHCRMCGPELSSSIASDQSKMENKPAPKPLEVYTDKESFLKDFLPHIDFIEEINFAGGEPLLIDAHYWALEALINHKRTNVRVRYSTNFTHLSKGHYYAPFFWNQFDYVQVGASLDAEGARAEYIRQGTHWAKILENREIVKRDAPNIDFRIFATVGLLNLMHIPDFFLKAIDEGFVQPDKIVTSNLMGPMHLSSIILPKRFKEEAQFKYESLIKELRSKGTPDWILGNLHSVIQYMNSSDRTDMLRTFFGDITKLDSFYERKFKDVFPEYKGLENYIK